MKELCLCKKNIQACEKECINSTFKKELKKLISIENENNKNMLSNSSCFFSGCKKNGINSHTIARSQLDSISLDNKILVVNDGIIHKIYPTKEEQLKSISIEEAFTFKGFCNPKHENIFNSKPNDVDHGDFEVNDQAISLILYRYVCRRLKLNNINNDDLNLTKNNIGIKKLLELNMIKLEYPWEDVEKWNTIELLVNNHIKSQLELLIFAKELYSSTEPEWIIKDFKIKSSPKFLGTFHSKIFSANIPLQYETLGHAYIDKNNNWSFFLATKRNNKNEMKVINSLRKEDIPFAIFWNLCKTGNIAISPFLNSQQKDELLNFCFDKIANPILEIQKIKKLHFLF